MVTISSHLHVGTLAFLIFFKTLCADPISTFSFTNFGKYPIFKSSLALHEDANVVNGGFALELSGFASSGSIMYNKPIKLVEGNSRKSVSFSSYIAFSMPLNDSGGLTFIMAPSRFRDVFENSSAAISLGLAQMKFKTVAVGFSTSAHSKNGNNRNSRVAINVSNLVLAKVRKSTSFNSSLGNGEKFQAWIDYEANSKRMEIRLSKFGDSRPFDALLWNSIDLLKIWEEEEEEEMIVGLSPFKWSTSKKCFVYFWSFQVRHVPEWMHSDPLNPNSFTKDTKSLTVNKARSDCLLKFLAGMVVGAICGALAAFTVLYLWTIFGNRRPVVPEELTLQPTDYEYKKVDVDKAIKAINKLGFRTNKISSQTQFTSSSMEVTQVSDHLERHDLHGKVVMVTVASIGLDLGFCHDLAKADLSADGAAIDKSVQAAWDAFGPIDALVNNAGIRGSWLVSKSVCRRMRDARDGGSIHISSNAGLNRGHVPGGVAYDSPKLL